MYFLLKMVIFHCYVSLPECRGFDEKVLKPVFLSRLSHETHISTVRCSPHWRLIRWNPLQMGQIFPVSILMYFGGGWTIIKNDQSFASNHCRFFCGSAIFKFQFNLWGKFIFFSWELHGSFIGKLWNFGFVVVKKYWLNMVCCKWLWRNERYIPKLPLTFEKEKLLDPKKMSN